MTKGEWRRLEWGAGVVAYAFAGVFGRRYPRITFGALGAATIAFLLWLARDEIRSRRELRAQHASLAARRLATRAAKDAQYRAAAANRAAAPPPGE